MSGASSGSPCHSSLKVQVNRRGDVAIVKLAGSARMDVSGELRDQLTGLITDETHQLVLDLSDLDFINSIGLGALVAAHLRCCHQNAVVKVVAPQPQIEEILNVTKLTHIFPVHPTVEEAIRAC